MYSPKSLFRDVLLFKFRLISLASWTVCLIPRSLLIIIDLFDETILISNDLGIKQTVGEAIEIKRNLNNNTSLNRDLGEYTLNPMYTKLIIKN